MKFNIDQEDFLIERNIKINNYDSYNSSFFYGEADHNDIYNIIINNVIKDNESNNYHFLDIGSGCGKLTLFFNNKTNCECTGIEIIEHRYLKSIQLINEDNYNVEFLCNDFKNIYLGNYDIIYCCNIIFSEDDNNMLYFKLNKEFHGYALLFTYNNKIKGKLISEFTVNTSWQSNVFVYLFYFN